MKTICIVFAIVCSAGCVYGLIQKTICLFLACFIALYLLGLLQYINKIRRYHKYLKNGVPHQARLVQSKQVQSSHQARLIEGTRYRFSVALNDTNQLVELFGTFEKIPVDANDECEVLVFNDGNQLHAILPNSTSKIDFFSLCLTRMGMLTLVAFLLGLIGSLFILGAVAFNSPQLSQTDERMNNILKGIFEE